MDGIFTFEVGGKNKDYKQIKDLENSFLALDDVEIGYSNKMRPLNISCQSNSDRRNPITPELKF